MGMDNEKAHMSEQIQELTLLLMYLTSWQESSTPGLRRKPHKTDDTLLRLNDPTQFEQVDETCEFGGAVLYSESLDMTAFLGIDAPRKI